MFERSKSIFLLPGQVTPVEQVTVLVVDPLQPFPPFAGAGLEQERVSTRVPSPQETEQAPAR